RPTAQAAARRNGIPVLHPSVRTFATTTRSPGLGRLHRGYSRPSLSPRRPWPPVTWPSANLAADHVPTSIYRAQRTSVNARHLHLPCTYLARLPHLALCI